MEIGAILAVAMSPSTAASKSESTPLMMYATNSSSSSSFPAAAILSARDVIFTTYSLIDMGPFCVVVKARSTLIVPAFDLQENMSSIMFHAWAAVFAPATCCSTSRDREEKTNPSTLLVLDEPGRVLRIGDDSLDLLVTISSFNLGRRGCGRAKDVPFQLRTSQGGENLRSPEGVILFVELLRNLEAKQRI